MSSRTHGRALCNWLSISAYLILVSVCPRRFGEMENLLPLPDIEKRLLVWPDQSPMSAHSINAL